MTQVKALGRVLSLFSTNITGKLQIRFPFLRAIEGSFMPSVGGKDRKRPRGDGCCADAAAGTAATDADGIPVLTDTSAVAARGGFKRLPWRPEGGTAGC